MSQIQELNERLNRVEKGQQRETSAHEIIELEQETKNLGRE